jgi:hypothetical protein
LRLRLSLFGALFLPESGVRDRAWRLWALSLPESGVVGQSLAFVGFVPCLKAVMGAELGVCGLCSLRESGVRGRAWRLWALSCMKAALGAELDVCGLCPCLKAVMGAELGREVVRQAQQPKAGA